jgi:hypothetical protein
MRRRRNIHGISASGVAGCGHVRNDRLKYEGHVCACAGVYGGGFFFPDGVDVLVELGVDGGADAPVVVAGVSLAE